MGITRIGYTGFVVTTAILMVREGVTVEAAGVFLTVALAGKWAYSRLTRTEPPPTSDTLLGAHEAPPLPAPEEVLKTEWITKRELAIVGTIAVVGVILYLSRDKGGSIHVVGSDVSLWVGVKPAESALRVGRHFTYPVPSGPHIGRVHDSAVGVGNDFQLRVQEGESFMVSTSPALCIVRIDMAALKYGQSPGATPPVMARFTNPSKPVLIPQNAFLDVEELPATPPEGPSPSLLTLISCAHARDDKSAWTAVRTRLPAIHELAQRAGYTDEQRELTATDTP
ncbi:hypothetical protein JYK02_08800 [Corallococcus macrosporus]|uniref:Sortase n=1 Tax=Corallococcus macrosporus TaxID=35 RepID=A0ABS3D7F5_9BACT|nr:hypothetical protein [Corallococcus macrosporus]MBN8227603.1 hypothetical protein [Corallococcus macrosporus]